MSTPRVRISKAHSTARAKKDSLETEETPVKVCAQNKSEENYNLKDNVSGN